MAKGKSNESKSYIGYKEEHNKVLTPSNHAGVGAFSGFVVRAILQPLDVVKIRFQLQVEPTIGQTAGIYRGVFQAFKTIIKTEGVKALWKGHVPAQALTITYGAGKFGSYAVMTKFISDINLSNNVSAQMTCGALSGVVGTVVSMPSDVARTKLVAQSVSNLQYTGLIDVFVKTCKHEGFTGLWRGLVPTLVMAMPFSAIELSCYSMIHQNLTKLVPEDNSLWSSSYGVSCAAISGIVAGVVAKSIVYPLDVLKKRRQIKGSESSRQGLGKIVKYRNTSDCIRRITMEEGALAWYKGLWPSLIKSGSVSGLIFVVYESTCALLILSSAGER